MKAIYILCMRQLKSYVRSPATDYRLAGTADFVSFGAGIRIRPHVCEGGRRKLFEFLAPGIVAMGDFIQGGFFGDRDYLGPAIRFLKETLVAPVSRLEIVFGRTWAGPLWR